MNFSSYGTRISAISFYSLLSQMNQQENALIYCPSAEEGRDVEFYISLLRMGRSASKSHISKICELQDVKPDCHGTRGVASTK